MKKSDFKKGDKVVLISGYRFEKEKYKGLIFTVKGLGNKHLTNQIELEDLGHEPIENLLKVYPERVFIASAYSILDITVTEKQTLKMHTFFEDNGISTIRIKTDTWWDRDNCTKFLFKGSSKDYKKAVDFASKLD